MSEENNNMYSVCVKVLLLDKLMGTLTTWHVNNSVQSSMYVLFAHNDICISKNIYVRLTPQSRALRMTRRILLTLNSQYETLAQN